MDQSSLPFLTVAELARLIESREVSPVEVTQAYLDRIDQLDFKFNAYLAVSRREAMQAARDAEDSIARGEYLGPMHGIPVAVKDQFWTQGIRSTGGTRILADFVPDEDATIIANLKRAGAVLLGKTNMTEFAMGAGFERFSPPRNPWNLDRRTGGSSGGSGAATAAFLCATSLGEDTGGSIRFPATWCGLVGHRPTWGLVSRYGVMTGVWSMDTAGPISRTVEDAAITLSAIAGRDERDPYTWERPVPDFRAGLNGNIEGLRIGLITEQIDEETTATDTRDAVLRALGVLGEMGAVVEEVSIPLTAHGAVLAQISAGGGAGAEHEGMGAGPPAGLRPQQPDWPADRQHLPSLRLPEGPEVADHVPQPGARSVGAVRRSGHPHVQRGGPAHRGRPHPREQGGRRSAELPADAHLQPGQRAGGIHTMRVQRRRYARGPADRRATRRRPDGVERGLRLRAGHRVAPAASSACVMQGGCRKPPDISRGRLPALHDRIRCARA